VDRDAVDVEKVCDDHGLRRAVSCLRVKCGGWEKGCVWQGELSDLEQHELRCEHRQPDEESSQHQEVSDLVATVEVLRGRMDLYEEELEKKEKDNLHLKQNILNLTEENKTEMRSLKEKIDQCCKKNLQLEKAVDECCEKNLRFEKTVDSLQKENGVLRKEMDALKNNEVRVLKEVDPVGSSKQMNKKRVVLTPYECKPDELDITKDNCVRFLEEGYFTALASDCGIINGAKGFYEVTLLKSVDLQIDCRIDCRIGWVTDEFLASAKNIVGDAKSYGYNPIYQKKDFFHLRHE